MYGDPHFRTFDGSDPQVTKIVKMWGSDPRLNHMWMVRTRSVEIQGLAWGDGSWAAGVAISGSFIGHHKLIAYNSMDLQQKKGIDNYFQGSITWDGKQIQTRDGVTKPMHGVRLTSQPLKDFTEMPRMRQGGDEKKRVHRFELPKQVTVWIIFTTIHWNGKLPIRHHPGAEVVISMPSYKGQGGWCGNFNGDPSDDKPGSVRFQGPLRSKEDMFRRAGLGSPQLLQTGRTMQNSTRDPCEADESLFSKAESACQHIDDTAIWRACMSDACTSGDPEMAEETTEDMLLLRALSSEKRNAASFPVDEEDDCCQ